MALQKVDFRPYFGLGLHACTMFLIGASVLFLPWWMVAPLGVIWALCAMLGLLSLSAKPERVLPFAIVPVAGWLLAVLAYALLR